MDEQSLLEWLRWMALMGVDNEVVMLQGGALERCAEAAVEIGRLRAALRYISSPTMSLPGGADAEQHALVADERAVRLALQTCIRTAREAL